MSIERQWLADLEGNGDGIVRSKVSIRHAPWVAHGHRLAWIESFSPYVEVGIHRRPQWRKGQKRIDVFGCEWNYPLEDLSGQVVTHPLADWSALDTYDPPNPDGWTDWESVERDFTAAKAKSRPCIGSVEHGFLFLRLTYLRGFEQFMMDTAEQPPELERLIALVEGYWTAVVQRYIDLGADLINFGDDLGLQDRLPISPAAWRRCIGPSYERIFALCRKHGVKVYLHTDGFIVPILDDLIGAGVDILNPQDFVNGLDTLADKVKGRVSIDLDIDRQFVTVNGTPEEIDAHIRSCVEKLGSPKGGLTMIWGVYPPTPGESIEAVIRAMDRYATMWT